MKLIFKLFIKNDLRKLSNYYYYYCQINFIQLIQHILKSIIDVYMVHKIPFRRIKNNLERIVYLHTQVVKLNLSTGHKYQF